LETPWDEWAERAVAACAVASRRGADLAAERLTVDAFWSPRLRRLFEAALTVDRSLDQEGRIMAVVEATGVPECEVRALVEDRPVMWDTSGGFAARVADAARRRAVMTLCARVYNELGRGARLAEVAAEVRQIEEAGCN
jgi:replicative DNA helicase